MTSRQAPSKQEAPWKLTLSLSLLLVLTLLISDWVQFGQVTLYPFLNRVSALFYIVLTGVLQMFGVTRNWRHWNFYLAFIIQAFGVGYALTYLLLGLPEQWNDPEMKVPLVFTVLAAWLAVGIVGTFCVFLFKNLKQIALEQGDD